MGTCVLRAELKMDANKIERMKILGHMLATTRNRTVASAAGAWDHMHYATH